MKAAIDGLEKAKPMLKAMAEITDSLQQPHAQELFNSANQEQSALGERMAILLQSLRGRQQVLAQFTEQTAKVEANLKTVQTQLANEEVAPESFDPLIDTIKEQISAIETQTQPLVDQLKPMKWPETILESQLQHAVALQEECEKKKIESEAKTRQEAVEREFEEMLAKLDKQRDELEAHLAELDFADMAELEKLQLEKLSPLIEEMKSFENEIASPNEKLMERRAQLKGKIMGELQAKMKEKLTEAAKEEQLTNDLATGIKDVRAKLERIQQQYDKGPRSLEQAKQDCDQLTALTKELDAVPSEQFKRKHLRDKLANNAKVVQNKANVG